MLFLSCCVFNEWIALKLLFCFVYLSYDSNSTITYSFFEKSVFVKNKIINKKINDIVVVVAVDVVVELSKKRLDWEKNSSRATTTCTITTKKQQSFFISGYSKERNYSSPSFPFVAPEFFFWWFTIAASRILMQNWKKSIWIQSIVSFANTSPYVYDCLRLVMSYLPCDVVLSDATRYLP